MMFLMRRQTVIITNRLGLHARAAAKLVKLVNAYKSEVHLARAESPQQIVDAKSIFGVLLLAATKNTSIEITAEGADEEAVIEALSKLITNKFGEE